MGIVILGAKPETEAQAQAKQTQKLIRYGGRLAVLGVEDGPLAMGWWHVAAPGSWDPVQDNSGTGLTFARSICFDEHGRHRRIAVNGYAADFRPPDGALCPACRERL
jgi:hypothetical protein